VKFCTLAKSKNELPPSQRIILEKIQKSPENFLRVPPKTKSLFRLCDPIVVGFPVSIHLGIIHPSIHPSFGLPPHFAKKKSENILAHYSQIF